MCLLKKQRIIVFGILLSVFIICLPKLSQFGFIFAEYLSKQPRVNYIIAIALSIIGFLSAYWQVLEGDKLNLNRAIRIYLSFGFGMSGIYYLIYISHLGCFNLPPDIAEGASIIDFVYFSFVTITTVGYGDIVPRHTFVRVLVLFQVLFAIALVIRVSKLNKKAT